MQFKNKRWVFVIYALLYLGNQTFLAVAAHNNASTYVYSNTSMLTTDNANTLTSNTTIFDQVNTTTQDVNISTHYSNVSVTTSPDSINYTFVSTKNNASQGEFVFGPVLSLNITTPIFEVAILVQGTGSIRLRSTDATEIDNAVLEWYEYCNEYVLGAWQNSGYDKSSLLLSFDWVQIDDKRLDVFFVGVHAKQSNIAIPICLESNETLQRNNNRDPEYDLTFQNITHIDDVCSRLTLGGFGKDLISTSRAKLVVKTNQEIRTLSKYMTYTYTVNSEHISRLSVSSSFVDILGLISLQDERSRSSVFDDSIISIRWWTPTLCITYGADLTCPYGTYSPTGYKCDLEKHGVHQSSWRSIADMCLLYNHEIGTRRREAASALCVDTFKGYLPVPSTLDQAKGINCFIAGHNNVWAGNKRVSGAECKNWKHTPGAFSPAIPAFSLWATDQPSCGENSMQIRRNGDWNDEEDSNDSNNVLCQKSTNCFTCNTNNCEVGFQREECRVKENEGGKKKTDAGCVQCDLQNCPADFYQIPCPGTGKQRFPQDRVTNPDAFWGCGACTKNADYKCPTGSFLPKCSGGSTVKNACKLCDVTPCNIASRPGRLTPSVHGYTMKSCEDSGAGGQWQDASCHECIQTDCAAGNYRAMCPGDTYVAAACIKCPLNDGSGLHCPVNTYKSDCVGGYGLNGNNERVLGKAFCIGCGDTKQSAAGSVSVTQCVCKPGFAHSENVEDDPTICVACEAGKYSITSVELLKNVCRSCPPGMVTAVDTGATSVGDCLCPIKFYKADIFATTCTKCRDAGTTTAVGSVLATGSPVSSVCVCDTSNGYISRLNVCTLCDGGSFLYEWEPGQFDCDPCPAGTYRSADSLEGCQSCGPGLFSSAGASECEICTGTVSADNTICTVPDVIQVPRIISGLNKIVFMHFKSGATVKSILNSVETPQWQNGDNVTIYADGTRGLNPLVLVYNQGWTPVNIDPIHRRDNVYFITTPRTNDGDELMSILWQNSVGVIPLSEQDYSQTIGMGVYYLRKSYGTLTQQEIRDHNAANSYYEPFAVRLINNLPDYTTEILYNTPTTVDPP